MERGEPNSLAQDDAEDAVQSDQVDVPQLKNGQSDNGLLDALVFMARHHGRIANRAELTRGLPLEQDGLPLSRLSEAAERLGLRIEIDRLRLSKVPAVTLPVVVVVPGKPAVVVEKIDLAAGTVKVIKPGISGAPGIIPLTEMDSARSVIVFFRPAAAETEDSTRASVARGWFWPAVRRFWPNYLQVVVAALIGNLLGLAVPLFVMNVYDRVIPNLAIPTLWALTAGVAIALLFDFVLKVLRMQIVDETGRRVDMAVAGRLFDHFLKLRMASRPASTGAVANQVRDLDTIRDALTSSSVIAVTDFLFIGVFVWVMWFLVGPLAWIPSAAVPIVVAVTFLVQFPLSRALAASQQDASRRQSVLVETVSSLETIKVSGAESWFRKAWDRSVAAASRSTASARYWANIASSFTAVVFQSVSIIIVVWGVFLVLEGRISVGALIAANILSGRVLAPLGNITQTLARLLHARTALGSLNALMQAKTEVGASARDIGPAGDGSVRLDSMSFAYPGTQVPALDTVSVSVNAGERVGIIGRVGSGKSSLVRIFAGLYEPDAGAVLLGGIDTRQFSAADMRSHVGLCLQDAELFTGTLRDNILVGAPHASAEELERAVNLAGVDTFTSNHPDGLDRPVEERGRSLSGGQRQAVSLARCLIRRPKILCLDEPTAYLDIMSGRQLCERLKRVAETGITLVVATHRDGPLELVDRLLLLDKGKLLMDGPKEEVINRLKAGARQDAGGGDAPR